jgi:hypothetical protein
MDIKAKAGGALIVSAGFFLIPAYLIDNEDFSSSGITADGQLLKVPSENVDEWDIEGTVSADVGMPVGNASVLPDNKFGGYQIQQDSSDKPVHIGSVIDPDRGADLSEDAIPIHIGKYIDPDRGPELSERTPIHIGEYMDPDDEGAETSDPEGVIRIGEFIDPDGEGTTVTEKRIEIFTKASGVPRE